MYKVELTTRNPLDQVIDQPEHQRQDIFGDHDIEADQIGHHR